MEVEKSGSMTNGANAKSFQERLSDIPTYTMTLSQLQSIYSTLKERNEVLKNAFNTGEQYVDRLTTAAKPVVWAATASALTVAKPIVGEIKDPVSTIDNCASEALAKVQEKFPFVKQTPSEIAESAKTRAVETANYYLEKVQSSTLGQQTAKQADNAVSFSELMVEICFPTDASNPDDLKELEIAEEDEEKGVVVRAGNLKDRAYRRGTRKLMSFQPVQTTIDTVQYAQTQMLDMTEKLRQGTNYMVEKSREAKDTVAANYPEIKQTVQHTITEGSKLLTQNWDHVYKTTMFIPKKALQVSGEVYISAQEIVFAYTKAHSITEMPHAVAEMVESYYKSLKKESPSIGEVKEKALAFVYVPAQVVSEYLESSRAVQWVVSRSIEMETLHIVESSPEEESEMEAVEAELVYDETDV